MHRACNCIPIVCTVVLSKKVLSDCLFFLCIFFFSLFCVIVRVHLHSISTSVAYCLLQICSRWPWHLCGLTEGEGPSYPLTSWAHNQRTLQGCHGSLEPNRGPPGLPLILGCAEDTDKYITCRKLTGILLSILKYICNQKIALWHLLVGQFFLFKC